MICKQPDEILLRGHGEQIIKKTNVYDLKIHIQGIEG
jgi:hypothetical protein